MPPKWRVRILLFGLFLLTLVSGYNYFNRPYFTESQDVVQPVDESPSASDSAVVAEVPTATALVAQLSVSDKIAQILALPVALGAPSSSENTASLSADISELFGERQTGIASQLRFRPGAVLIVGQKISSAQVAAMIAELKQTEFATGSATEFIQPLMLVDHEGGRVQRLSGDGFSLLPSRQDMCALTREERIGLLNKSAIELRQAGVTVVLAPVIDTGTKESVLGDRVCSSDASIVATTAAEYISVFLENNIVPVIKHYPGIGTARYDLHTRFDSVVVDPDDVSIYKRLLGAFPFLPVMISHVGVTNQFAHIPCSLSVDCVQELTSVFPTVVTLTDALDMKSARATKGNSAIQRQLTDVVIDAVAAGNSLILLGESVSAGDQEKVFGSLMREYKTNATFASKVDSAVLKVLDLKLRIARDAAESAQTTKNTEE